VIEKQAAGYYVLGDPGPAVTLFVSQRKISEGTFVSLAALVKEISNQVDHYGSIAKIAAASVGNIRDEMCLASEALRFLMKDNENALSKPEVAVLNTTRLNSTARPDSSRSGSRSRWRSPSDWAR
jgi:inorganic phosphate transporter, PiT family